MRELLKDGTFARRSIAVIALAFCAASCQTTSPVARSDEVGAAVREAMVIVRPETILPRRFEARAPMAKAPEEPLLLAPALLTESEVVRPRAELRAGPGAQFELADAMLEQGARVVVFSQVGVWLKVFAPESSRRGWVHERALAPLRPTDAAMRLDARELPTVLALRPVAAARSFPDLQARRVAIPKGTMFRALRGEGEKTLVWLAETNSVMWLSQKDVQ